MRAGPSQSSWARRGALVAATGLTLLAMPAMASAATTYHASPAGSGTTCSSGAPCKVEQALATAISGDTVVMAGDEGSYGTPATPIAPELGIPGGVVLEGAAGQPMPQVHSNNAATAVRLEGAGARVSNVAIHSAGSEAAVKGVGTIERVLALAGGAAAVGCEPGPGMTIVDSVCSGFSGVYMNVGETWNVVLRNSTIVGSDTGLFARSTAGAVQITAINTIVRGTTTDIRAEQIGVGTTVSVSLDHSNYANVETGGGASVTPAGSGTNQLAPPLFANAAAGDFSQASGSPTIDAGVNEAANGPLDLAGNARSLPRLITCAGAGPAITDIGAYELVPATPMCAPPPSDAPAAPASTTSIVAAKIRAHGATFRFRGTGVGFECKLDRKPFRPCSSPKSYKRLKPGKHRFSVRAVGGGGSDSSPAVRRFRTG